MIKTVVTVVFHMLSFASMCTVMELLLRSPCITSDIVIKWLIAGLLFSLGWTFFMKKQQAP